ncbi:MAG: RND family efflux transporter MFP subunit [Candidatus Latescibacterota bacterium]|jgi:RND family efflux transporter MFP subunit
MNKFFKMILPLLIIGAGVGSFMLLKSMQKAPERVERPNLGPLVEAVEAPAQKVQVIVDGQGTVRPDAQINLVPQVSGVIVWKTEAFKPGGSFAKGETLFRIDPRDYELAVRQAEAQVAQARYQRDLAQQESDVSRQEWQRMRGDDAKASDLVLRLPQLRSAEANLASADARLEEMALRLERTELKAPFSGRVRNSQVDVGQYINVGQSVAQLYSIEKAEIVVPVPDEDLAWFALPVPVDAQSDKFAELPVDSGRDEGMSRSHLFARRGADAVVQGSFAGRRHEWQGRVVRTEGELDPQSRMARLVIEVDDPYGGIVDGAPPLTVGMFVDVAIAGRQVEGVRIVPRAALRQDDKVWIVGSDGLLRVRQADVLRRMQDDVLAYIELERNERIITSQLSGVTDGMKVRLADGSKEAGS